MQYIESPKNAVGRVCTRFSSNTAVEEFSININIKYYMRVHFVRKSKNVTGHCVLVRPRTGTRSPTNKNPTGTPCAQPVLRGVLYCVVLEYRQIKSIFLL